MAASGLGKALWHPMATVQNLDPRKNRLPKMRSLGTPGRAAGEATEATGDTPLPGSLHGRPGIRSNVDCPRSG